MTVRLSVDCLLLFAVDTMEALEMPEEWRFMSLLSDKELKDLLYSNCFKIVDRLSSG